MYMKNSVLAHKLDLKSFHAADVDLLSVEYQSWPWISFNNDLPEHYSYLQLSHTSKNSNFSL